MLLLFQGLIPLFSGFFAGIFKLHLENRAEQQRMLIERVRAFDKSAERAASISDKGISFTRRSIALIFTLGIFIILVTLVFFGLTNPSAVVNVPVTEYSNTLLSWLGFTKPNTIIKYEEIRGAVLPAEIIQPVVESLQVIVGFYFGSTRGK
jgi:hypothetical protein